MGAKLARVTDPRALDRATGPRASLSVAVPGGWLADGARVEIEAPRILRCARCRGGGCDGCERSGALRAPEDAAGRRVVVELPGGGAEALRMRLPTPFEEGEIEQLILAFDAAAEPDARVRRLDAVRQRPERPLWPIFALAVLAIGLSCLWLL